MRVAALPGHLERRGRAMVADGMTSARGRRPNTESDDRPALAKDVIRLREETRSLRSGVKAQHTISRASPNRGKQGAAAWPVEPDPVQPAPRLGQAGRAYFSAGVKQDFLVLALINSAPRRQGRQIGVSPDRRVT